MRLIAMPAPFPIHRRVHLGPLTLRINWVVFACIVATIGGLVRLGIWQLNRAAEKIAAQAAVEAEARRSPRPIESLTSAELEASNPQLRNLHVALDGVYDNDHTILVLAQFLDDQIGYEVVTPLRLDSNGGLVLVSRGWTTGILPPNTPPMTQPVAGPVRLLAQIHVPPAGQRIPPSQVDASQWPLRVRGIEIPIIEATLGESVFPFVVRLTPDQPGMLARHWAEANADVDTHLSYALQWFTFAVMVLLGSLFAGSNLLELMRDRPTRGLDPDA